jgi:hypothetical protein
VTSEFFCLSCSRTVYSRPDETCPVCSSPLLEVAGTTSDAEADGIVEVEKVVVLDDGAEAVVRTDETHPSEAAAVEPLD